MIFAPRLCMNKTSRLRHLLLPATLIVLVLSANAYAELDYEFAKGLMERHSSTFETYELVERLITKLQDLPNAKLESLLIKAALRRKQAEGASIEKRKALLDEADALYKEFLVGGAGHRLAYIAESEASSLRSDMVRSQIAAAKELEKSDPAKAKSVRAEAGLTMGKIADSFKPALDAAQPAFKDAFENYRKWNEKNNPEGDKPIPREILAPLDKAFTAWIVADRKYLAAKVDQVDCYDDSDPEKKKLAEALVKICEERQSDEAIGNFPIVGAWYAFMQGRIYASIQSEDKASEAWNNALTMTSDMTNLADDQKRQLLSIKRAILHDLVKMKVRKGKYSDVVESVGQSLIDTSLRPLFEESAGKDLLIEYAKAMVMQPEAGVSDVENAVKVMRDRIEKENRPGGNPVWAGRFSLAIADIMLEARKHKPPLKPQLSAQEWYDAARGYFINGQQEHQKYTELASGDPEKAKPQFEKAYEQFSAAVEYYRRAISAARGSGTDLYHRLQCEPKAWFEMGLCYVKMENYLEAVLAYQALRDTFGAENRARWMPDPAKPEGKKLLGPQVLALLEEYEKPKEGLLPRGNTNLLYALDKHIAAHKDVWSGALKGRLLTDMKNDPAMDAGISDADYVNAKASMELAKSLAAAGRLDKDPKTSAETHEQALAKYLEGGEQFSKVKKTSIAYETALYQAGTCYTLAEEILADGRVRGSKEDLAAQTKAATEKALTLFQQYDDLIASLANPTDEERQRRQGLQGAVQLARGSLFLGVREWEKAVKASDDYLLWEKNNPVPKSSSSIALLNKFRALIELTAANLAPKSDPYLKEAEATLAKWHETKPKDSKTYVFMANALSRRYLIASAQAAKLNLGKELVETYERKLTDLQWSRIELLAENDADDLTMEDYTRMLFLFNKTSQERRAVDWGVKLLAKFDPQNKNMRIADDEIVWQAMLERMYRIIRFDDLQKWENCKRDHRILVDFMYDTGKGRSYDEMSEKRPEFDRYNQNLSKARAQIGTIRNNYRDCKTLDSTLGNNGTSMIGAIEDEIDFRQKIEATRDMVASLALCVAGKLDLESSKQEDARKYREIANDQIKALIEIRGETPAMQIKSAEINMSNGKYEEALQTLYHVLDDAEKDSANYLEAKRRISETFALMKKFGDAVEFPEFVALTIGFESKYVKEHWPNMKDFLKECYKNGANMPAKIRELLEGQSEKPLAPAQDEKPSDSIKDAKATVNSKTM
ncbi:MAG: hypothetical protein KIS92_05270 [Planctomycetota bacterium]|nr:hypothetical protein [Planctomycetota bacterium]